MDHCYRQLCTGTGIVFVRGCSFVREVMLMPLRTWESNEPTLTPMPNKIPITPIAPAPRALPSGAPPRVKHGVLFMDADLRVIAADPAFYTSFNVKKEDTEGRLVQDLGDGQWKSPELRALLEGVLTPDGAFVDFEVRHDFLEGVGQRNMLIRGDRTDQSVPFALIRMGIEDGTTRRAAEEELRHTEVRYRRLFQTAKDGILILDAHTGVIIAANAFMEGLVGLESGELLGKELYQIGMFKDIAHNKAAFRELQRNRYIRYEHLPVQDQRGGTVEVEFIANVYHENDRLVAQCNVRDISTRVALEKKVAQQAGALADEARSKDEFLAMLSHELRNPLAPIRSAVHLLKLQQPSDVNPIQREALEVIDRQVGNLTKLVSDLLEVSRVINGRIHFNMQTVDLYQVVQHAMQTVMPLVEKHRHTLALLPCGTAPVWVRADALRMEEVFINLLTNAAKYTPAGGTINVACNTHAGEVSMHISDTGVGVAPELLPRLFDLFTQADRTLDRSEGGLGIGLALAHRLVVLQGGTIQAKSDGLGKGSCFTVRIPLISEPVVDLEAIATSAMGPAANGKRVLVVDDNVDLVTMLTTTLRYKGYLVQSAHTGPDGLLIAAHWLPEIVLLDIGLPGINGYEVARRLRADPRTAKARLIALTGYGQESDIALTREAGFNAHLVKPYEFDQLEKLMVEEG
jgi:PAS domain S-box-containing protein